MYTKSEIERLKVDTRFLLSEEERYCIIGLHQGYRPTKKDVQNQANFCILEAVSAYRERKITSDRLNMILDKIDVFVYADDMLGHKNVINKFNREIIEKELHIPHFNSLCVICEEFYDSF